MNTELPPLPSVSPTENFGKWETHSKDMQQRERTIKIALVIFAAIVTAACVAAAIACPLLLPIYGLGGVCVAFGVAGAIGVPVITTLIWAEMWGGRNKKYSEAETAQDICYRLTCPGILADYIVRNKNNRTMWYETYLDWNALEKYGYLPAQIIKDSKKIEEDASFLIRTMETLRFDLVSRGRMQQDQQEIMKTIREHQARLDKLSEEWEKKKEIFRQELPYAAAAPDPYPQV